ncbi:class I SAM-dependent methyltransferase [Plantactinospora sp. CA-290183]|uniref:class I SAM-dependent methyltransferase n=1 Tax=Plantactinospora sp. CA-290183 TaxID=3240006 RepID=UPI003D942740
MTGEPLWNWVDPEASALARQAIDARLARRDRLEPLSAPGMRITSDDMLRWALTGAEFGTLRTRHHQGLAVDTVTLHAGDRRTEPGVLYRVDDTGYFLPVDVTGPLPFGDGTLDWAYAEHLIEHLRLGQAIDWLREVRRVLRPGGVLRLTTPDLSRYTQAHADPAGPFFAEHRSRIDAVVPAVTPMPDRPAFMLNQLFYQFGHRWIYDEQELRYALEQAGFVRDTTSRCAFRSGRDPHLSALDSELRQDETLYLQAVR